MQYELFVAPDGSYGQLEGEGEDSWGGMVGELAAKRADIGLGALSVMAERETVIGTALLPIKHNIHYLLKINDDFPKVEELRFG